MCRLGLSYDFTFLSILLSSIYAKEENISSFRCFLHPLQKKYAVVPGEILDYCAKMSVLLTYYKLFDDINDKSFNPLHAFFPFFALSAKKIKKEFFEKANVIKTKLSALSEAEKNNVREIDIPAGIFGEITGEIFDIYGNNIVLRTFGKDMGRWLYIIDAIDDYEKDKKKNAYNPVDKLDESVTAPLWYNLSSASAAYELLDINRNKDLLDNIIYLGIKDSTFRVINKEKKPE